MNTSTYLSALHAISEVGTGLDHNIFTLLKECSAEVLFKHLKSYIAPLYDNAVMAKIIQKQAQVNLEWMANQLSAHGVTVLGMDHECYPQSLSCLHKKPSLLYARGNLSLLQQPLLSVVGSRAMSMYGKQSIHHLFNRLPPSISIVTGLARGVDSYVLQLQNRRGVPSVVVLPSSIAHVTPAVHRSLAQDVLQHGGLLLSETPLGASVQKFRFVKRNRIISALSRATVVVEAAKRSGSLITARFALEQGKDVFAVPGSIFSDVSEGTNTLLVDGEAHPLTASEQLSALFDLSCSDEEKIQVPNLEYFTMNEQTTSEIMRAMNVALPQFLERVTLLVSQGYVVRTKQGGWVRLH